MNVQLIVRIDGREVACVGGVVEICKALALEEQVERLKDRVGQVLLETGCDRLARSLRHPCCCGRSMENRGRRAVTINSLSGPFVLERNRYRCRACGAWQTPADAVICCGRHRMTRHLAKQVCQLATLDHFTHLEQLMQDQHGVMLGHDPMMKLVHDVGGRAEAERLAEAQRWRSMPTDQRQWPEPEVTPRRVHVSCDGVMYCTNQAEPHPRNPESNRLIWRQMRVGCVYWQDDSERWHKQVVWGQEEDYQSFGASLYRLACRCGYRQAEQTVFAADGADWCWGIHQQYFGDATGILDWYHASEHVWECGRALHADEEPLKMLWVDEALSQLWESGGEGLLKWLIAQKAQLRTSKRAALETLIAYVQPRLDRMDYPVYREQEFPIGTGMMESTGKQLIGCRLKGPGMHWCPHGATAITALRTKDLNSQWHPFWKTLTL